MGEWVGGWMGGWVDGMDGLNRCGCAAHEMSARVGEPPMNNERIWSRVVPLPPAAPPYSHWGAAHR